MTGRRRPASSPGAAPRASGRGLRPRNPRGAAPEGGGAPHREVRQFGHWATPVARELGMPNLNQVASLDLALTDATGSGADLVPVAVRRAR